LGLSLGTSEDFDIPEYTRRGGVAYSDDLVWLAFATIRSTQNLENVRITDPWFMGEVFNESWSLLCPSALAPDALDQVSHIWISHEHPDHLHFPTLKAIPAEQKARITLLYQQHFSPRVVQALRALGFRAVQELSLGRWQALDAGVSVLCGSVGTVDSWLAVRAAGVTVLNVNDCILTPTLLQTMVSRIGPVDTLLMQFSIANWAGNPEETSVAKSAEVLDRMRLCIERLRPRVTIPFASFVYFSHTENRHMNAWVNTPDTVVQALSDSPTQLQFLYNGDSWSSDRSHNGKNSKKSGARTFVADVTDTADVADVVCTHGDPLERYRTAFAQIESLPFRSHPSVPLEELLPLGQQLIAQVRASFPRLLLRRAVPLFLYLDDLQTGLCFDLGAGHIEGVNRPRHSCDMALGSQALQFALRFPWGFSTLEVSGRYTLLNPDSSGLALYLCHVFATDIHPGQAWRRFFAARTWRFCWSKKTELLGRLRNYNPLGHDIRKGAPVANSLPPLPRS
jgi:UDP-MurNAc hydroxylase